MCVKCDIEKKQVLTAMGGSRWKAGKNHLGFLCSGYELLIRRRTDERSRNKGPPEQDDCINWALLFRETYILTVDPQAS